MSNSSREAEFACERADEYVEGLLSSDEERTFLAHLASCVRCQRDLDAELQLRAVEERIRAERSRVVPFRAIRRRFAVGGAAALAAALLVALYARPAPTPLLITSSNRSIEGRIAYAGADPHRAYDPMRGGSGAPGDEVSPEVIAELYRHGDLHGVAAAHLLEGELAEASRELARAPRSPDTDNDRALVLIVQSQRRESARLEEALTLLDDVLRRVPDHRQALWNRGLVLDALGLRLAAAGSFERVAALDPEWRTEAEARAKELRRGSEDRGAWWTARQLGYEMLDGKAPLTPEMAHLFPGIARVYFHDAVRLAGTRERLQELAPLAAELDRSYGGDELSQTLEAARSHLRAERLPLLKGYLDFVHLRSTLDDAGWRRWLAQARKAGADDLVLGALVLTGRSREELGDLHRIVSATHSPWFEMLEAAEQAKAAYAKGDTTSSEQLVLGAIGRCDAERVRYRCLMLQEYLVVLHLEAHRLQAAQATALKALALARPPGNEWGQISVLMRQLGDTERLRSRFALARAYYEEAELGTPADHCETRRDLLLNLAELYVIEGRPEGARREALAAGMCPTSPLAGPGLGVHLDLYRIGTPVITEDALRREIEGFRQQPGITPGDRLFADFAEARLVIDREPARGEALLRSVIKEAAQRRKDMTAMKTSSYAYTMLLVDAARRGAYDAMAPLLVEEQGGREVPATCAVAIARDDFRLAVAVRGARGEVAGSYTERAQPGERTPRLQPDLLLHLAGCPEVRVLAQPPLAGIARLLPTDLAWSYQITSGANGPSPAADSCAAGTTQEARSSHRRVVVASSSPPSWLGLPSLRDWDAPEGTGNGEVLLLRGAEATPSRVLSELPRATEIQFHVHALTDRTKSDAPVLALTENSAHVWALRAEDLRPGSLQCHPLVLLADCHAGELADWMHAAWGLPTAFLAAGAGAVVASPEDVPDREATLFVDGVVTRIRGGVTPAKAVSAEKRAWLERQPESWVTDVIVFQ